ncbi:MAG: ATP-binding protein [Tissierellales bacterium]|nr:ATP-binding protein [Tissierellales bacterium]MBN2827529.1 ATP-binding protein [Tissierellales bacterium]
MKQLLILSGKGGTGKTTVAASFIKLTQNKMFADCDVDAPNLNLVFNGGEILESTDFFGLKKAVKNYDICIDCGKCEELCRFNAFENGILNPMYCEGCGVCEAFCPVFDENGKKAIHLEDNISGHNVVELYNQEVFSHASLEVGNGASGKLVTEVRKKLYSNKRDEEFAIIDGSPGIGCPVIASLTGMNYVLIVAEPTLSGIHDMKRIVQTARVFGIQCGMCVNKYDINVEMTKRIEEYCLDENIAFLGKIPYDNKVLEALNEGKIVVDYEDSPAAEQIKEILTKVKKIMKIDGGIHENSSSKH